MNTLENNAAGRTVTGTDDLGLIDLDDQILDDVDGGWVYETAAVVTVGAGLGLGYVAGRGDGYGANRDRGGSGGGSGGSGGGK